ncbi:MAG: carboxymuconolactone decarboxylase family protein [Planctomycetota bacterium]
MQEVLTQARRDFGAAVEPVTLHRAVPPLLAAVWAVLRETLVVGAVPRATKEAVAVGVSRANQCPYCVDAHSIMLRAIGDPVPTAAASNPTSNPTSNSTSAPQLATLDATAQRAWGADFGNSSGRPDSASRFHDALAAASDSDRAELCATAFAFHYINRVVAVFLGDSPIPVKVPILRGLSWWLSARFFARAIRRAHPPGESLGFLSNADSPRSDLPEIAWAGAAPHAARAITALITTLDEAAAMLLTESARALVQEQLASWHGESAPLALSWLDQATDSLPADARSAARIALLAARAPYRLHADDVDRFRQACPPEFRESYSGQATAPAHADVAADAALVSVVGWGALAATRRVAEWAFPTRGTAPSSR